MPIQTVLVMLVPPDQSTMQDRSTRPSEVNVPPPQPIGGITGAGSQAQSSVTEVAVYQRLHAVALRGRGVAVGCDRLGLGGGCEYQTRRHDESRCHPPHGSRPLIVRVAIDSSEPLASTRISRAPAATKSSECESSSGCPDPAGSRCGPPSSLERSMPTRPPRVPRPSAPPPRAASPGVPSPSPRQLVVRDGGEPRRPKPLLRWQRQWTGLQPAGWGRPGQPVWERPA